MNRRRTWSAWLTAVGVGGPITWQLGGYVSEHWMNIETWVLLSIGLVSGARALYVLIDYFRALDALVR